MRKWPGGPTVCGSGLPRSAYQFKLSSGVASEHKPADMLPVTWVTSFQVLVTS